MGRFYRLDYATLGNVERTPQGGLKIPALLTRTGVFVYHDAVTGKTTREYRPPDEVFSDRAQASLRAAPVTLGHPPEALKPDNYRAYAVGHVGDDVKKEGDKVSATIYVQDDHAIRMIDAGWREASCGYNCDTDNTPGVTPDGEAYDRIQRNIFYNHAAIVEAGRAGSDVRLRLDSAGNSMHGEKTMNDKIEIVDGIEYPIGSDAHRAAKTRQDAAQKTAASEVTRLTKERDEASARADAAEQRLGKLKELLTPARLDAAVRNRTAVLSKATATLGAEFKSDGLSNAEVKRAVVAKAYPELKLDGKSPDYVSALFDTVAAKKPEPVIEQRNDALDAVRAAVTPVPGLNAQAPQTVEKIRRDAADDQNMRSSRPLALSRRSVYKELSSKPMLQAAQMEAQK